MVSECSTERCIATRETAGGVYLSQRGRNVVNKGDREKAKDRCGDDISSDA